MKINFEHTNILLLLGFIPLLALAVYWLFQKKRAIFKKLGSAGVLKSLIPGYSPVYQVVKYVFMLLALSLLIIGAANPRKPGSMENVQRTGIDLMIALDVSKSMLSEDIQPNRLEAAKDYIRGLLAESEDDRIGLIVFAGKSYMQMPLSTDHNAALMYLRYAGPDMVTTQGTNLSEVMDMAGRAFDSKDRKFKALVLVTDGEEHHQGAEEMIATLRQNGIMVVTIGIGTTRGGEVKEPLTGVAKKDASGNIIISKLNEQLLQQIAEGTNGKYIQLNEIDKAIEATREQLAGIEKTTLEDQAFMTYKNYFQWFIVAGLLLLLIEFIFPEVKHEK